MYVFCGCGSSANVNVIKLAFVKNIIRIISNWSVHPGRWGNLSLEHAPSVPNFSVIDYEGSYQGKFLDLLTLSKYNTDKSLAKQINILHLKNLILPNQENLTQKNEKKQYW